MKYQVQENCLTIYLPREVDHHNAEDSFIVLCYKKVRV